MLGRLDLLFPARPAVLVKMLENWRVGGEDTGVPVERVFYLRHEKGEWYLDGRCRVLPNELDVVFDRGPTGKPGSFLESLEEQAYEEVMAAGAW
ncbi:MAG: hypothetical protein AB1609_12260 [Bacillota bacterium]